MAETPRIDPSIVLKSKHWRGLLGDAAPSASDISRPWATMLLSRSARSSSSVPLAAYPIMTGLSNLPFAPSLDPPEVWGTPG
jgi:hypothetical protein